MEYIYLYININDKKTQPLNKYFGISLQNLVEIKAREHDGEQELCLLLNIVLQRALNPLRGQIPYAEKEPKR